MNHTIELLKQHRSERSYLDKPIPEEVLSAIIDKVHLSPTSVNSQQVSIVVVRDPARRARIAEIAGGQSVHKSATGIAMSGNTQHAHERVESIISGASITPMSCLRCYSKVLNWNSNIYPGPLSGSVIPQ